MSFYVKNCISNERRVFKTQHQQYTIINPLPPTWFIINISKKVASYGGSY